MQYIFLKIDDSNMSEEVLETLYAKLLKAVDSHTNKARVAAFRTGDPDLFHEYVSEDVAEDMRTAK